MGMLHEWREDTRGVLIGNTGKKPVSLPWLKLENIKVGLKEIIW